MISKRSRPSTGIGGASELTAVGAAFCSGLAEGAGALDLEWEHPLTSKIGKQDRQRAR